MRLDHFTRGDTRRDSIKPTAVRAYDHHEPPWGFLLLSYKETNTMPAVTDSRTLRIMARNVHENAIVKQSIEDTYGAEAAYKQARTFANRSIECAPDAGQRLSAEHIAALIDEDFQQFNIEHQPESTILGRMGPIAREHVQAMPLLERELFLEVIDLTDRINVNNRELAHLQQRLETL